MRRKDCTDQFLLGYLDTALFTTDPNQPGGCDYVESGRSEEMFDRLPSSFIAKAQSDCTKFQIENANLLSKAGSAWQNGSDFWYTRQRHGVGFWDRGYPDEVADPLTESCHRFGECYELDESDLENEESELPYPPNARP